MRSLADENIHSKLLPFLHSLGHDARPIAKGTPDPEVAAQAKVESRIVLTHDRDFANCDQYPASTHVGIMLFRIPPLYLDTLKTGLMRLLSSRPEADLAGRRFLIFEDTFVELPEGESLPSWND